MTDTANIHALSINAEEIQTRVSEAAARAGRARDEITIVAVSKTFPREAVDAAWELGFRVFGESRVQEIREKFATPLPQGGSLHMIGQLQTNKVRQVVPHVTAIETVDRASLKESLAKELPKRDLTMSVLLQVNVSGEEQKSGCAPDEAQGLLRQILDVPALRCEGLMTMAPLVDDPEDARPTFRGLRELRDRMQEATGSTLPVLSMGMSNDFEIAIEEGATHVRLGRSLFGAR
jgi:pyridoxal phosphate enzyme (YggS family)